MRLDETKLSFDEMERRIALIPDGPSSYLKTPGWALVLNGIGTMGIAMGLLPSLLIKFMSPQLWMVNLALVGLWMSIFAYALPFALTVWTVVRSSTRWKSELIEQMDHDSEQVRSLSRWLHGFSDADIDQLLRFATMSRERLTQKLGFLAGGVERLGVLPVVVAMAIQAKAFLELGQIPLWQVLLGMSSALLYAVAMVGSLMRLRMQLYESFLCEAKASRPRAA